MSAPEIYVLLADDHVMMRRGLRALIETMPGWAVCEEVGNGREAVAAAARLDPDIVVMDLSMPDLNGLEATRQIKKARPETEVLIFTGLETEELVQQVFAAGARSYLLKTAGREQIEAALRALAAHRSYFTSEVGEILFARVLKEKRVSGAGADIGRLTQREREIVQLLCEGRSNKEVAGKLGISTKTAETHRAAVMRKLQLPSFSDLVRYAIRNRIIAP